LEGKEGLPSFYIDEVKSLFSGPVRFKRESIADVLPHLTEVGSDEEAKRRIVKDLWEIPESKQEKDNEKIALSLYNEFRNEPEFQKVIERLFQPIEGAIRDDGARCQFVPLGHIWSPTALEEYGECPYRYFADKVLRLESETEGIDIMRRGNILHDVLEKFFKWYTEVKKGEVDFEEAKQYCFERFQELWQEEPLSGDRWYRVELEKRNMQEILLEILHLELIRKRPPLEGLCPAYIEFKVAFAKDKKDCLQITGEKGAALIRGKIDRIDVTADNQFALVIDYKTGKKFEAGKLANGTYLQLPLYLLAVKDRLGLKPLGGHLYSLVNGQSSGFHHKDNLAIAGIATRKGLSYDADKFEAVLKRAVDFAVKYVSGIERAEIPVRPRDCVPYCPYGTICRIEKWRLKHIYHEIAEEDEKED
jgi:ATP-dependent helicase/DNAse subunit B